MKSFMDQAGREWALKANVTSLSRVRENLDIDLTNLAADNMIDRLFHDQVIVGRIVYWMCKPQADERKLSPDDFGEELYGDVCGNVLQALLDELVNFSQNRRDREHLQNVFNVMLKTMDKMRDRVDVRIEAGDVERMMESAAEASLEPSGSMPVSLESTPAP